MCKTECKLGSTWKTIILSYIVLIVLSSTTNISEALPLVYSSTVDMKNSHVYGNPSDSVLQNENESGVFADSSPTLYTWCQMKERNQSYRKITRSKRYVLQGSRWPIKNLTYKILKYPKGLVKSDVDAEISKALNVWSEYSQLTFTTKQNEAVDIEISFDVIENDDPFDGPGKVLARSYFPKSGGNVYFDSDEYWTIGNRRGINLFQAAAHEFGHSLGLSHSKKKSALMAPFYRGYTPDFKLDQDDITAIQALYGKKEVISPKT